MSVIEDYLDDYVSSLSDEKSGDPVSKIFEKYTVRDIRKIDLKLKKLNHDSKNSLEQLVGSKYRSLIKIAEDINKIHNEVTLNNDQITQLSYRRSRFINFGSRNTSNKYDNLQEKVVGKNSMEYNIKILRGLFNEVFLPLDIELSIKGNQSLRWPTSFYLYYGRYFFTVASTFKEVLQYDVFLKKQFDDVKMRLLGTLKSELSAYIFSEMEGNDDSIFYSRGHLTLDAVLIDIEKKLNDMNYSESFAIVSFEDFSDQNGIGRIFSEDSFTCSEFPIVNLLVAFLLLNDSSSVCGASLINFFLELRIAYFNELISTSLSKIRDFPNFKINYPALIRYYECTCLIVKRFFKDGGGSLAKALGQLGVWGSHEIIKSSRFLPNQKIQFTKVPSEGFFVTETYENIGLNYFPELIINSSIICLEQLELISGLNVTEKINLINNNCSQVLRSIIDVSLSNNTPEPSQLLSYINTNPEKLISLFRCTFERERAIITSHINTLCANIVPEILKEWDQIRSFSIINANPQNDNSNYLLVQNNSNLTISNLDSYVTSISQFAANSLYDFNQKSFLELNKWFFTTSSLFKTLRFDTKDAKEGSIPFGTIADEREMLLIKGSIFYKDITKYIIEWGTIMMQKTTEILDKELLSFIETLEAKLQAMIADDSLQDIYGLLMVIITFESNFTRLSSMVTLDLQILNECNRIARKYIQLVLQSTLSRTFSNGKKFMSEFIGCLEAEHLTKNINLSRPSLKLSYLMTALSKFIVNPFSEMLCNIEIQNNIFCSGMTKKHFVSIKKTWFQENIIEEGFFAQFNAYRLNLDNAEDSVQDERIPQKNEGFEDIIYCYFLQLAYLQQFTDSSIHINTPTIVQFIDSLKTFNLDESKFEELLKVSQDFYKSNKLLYIPLSIVN